MRKSVIAAQSADTLGDKVTRSARMRFIQVIISG